MKKPNARNLTSSDAQLAAATLNAFMDWLSDGEDEISTGSLNAVCLAALDARTPPYMAVEVLIAALSFGDDTAMLTFGPEDFRENYGELEQVLDDVRAILKRHGVAGTTEPWRNAYAHAAAFLLNDAYSLSILEQLRSDPSERVRDTACVSCVVRARLGDPVSISSPEPRLASIVAHAYYHGTVSDDALVASVLPYIGEWAKGYDSGDLIWFRVLSAIVEAQPPSYQLDLASQVLSFAPSSVERAAREFCERLRDL